MKDSGSGISPQDIPKLFTKFAQTQSTTTQNSGGYGLGLAICKRYLNLLLLDVWLWFGFVRLYIQYMQVSLPVFDVLQFLWTRFEKTIFI